MIMGQRGNNPKEPHILLAFAKHGTDVATLCWVTELAPPGLAWHPCMIPHVAQEQGRISNTLLCPVFLLS